jgi:tellurium resistance protein TerZ
MTRQEKFQMAISLSKGQTISLEKSGGGITKLHMGLGWDPVPKKKGGFLSGLLGGGGGGDIDLDASCVVFDAAGEMLDLVWFRALKSKDGSIVHTGDNLTGEGDGDDEAIKVDVSRLPADDASKKELCRYTLAEKGRHTGVVMGVLSRAAGTWSFKAVGTPAEGRTAQDMVAAAKQFI